MGIKEFLKNNWARVILSFMFFLFVWVGVSVFTCSGGMGKTWSPFCNSGFWEIVLYIFGWPLISSRYLADGNTFLDLIIGIFSLVLQFIYIYFILSLVKFFSKKMVGDKE